MNVKITFNVEADLLMRAQAAARAQNTSLTDAFQAWLANYADGKAVWDDLKTFEAGKKFTRDEMNER